MGYVIRDFPSKEVYIDQYFAEKSYDLATYDPIVPEDVRYALDTSDESVECHALPKHVEDVLYGR